MSKVPCFVAAVQSPFGIRVRIMAGAAAAVRTGMAAGRKMPAERGGMGNHSGAVAGHGKVIRVNQPKPDGRKDGQDGKDFLQCRFRIIGGRLSIHDVIYDIPGGNSTWIFRFYQFAIGANNFLGFFPFLPGGSSAERE